MTTRYNGKKTSFNIYNSKIEPVTPRFNLETEQENQWFEMNGHKVYYESTEDKNGVDISLQVKKHHKNIYIDGVRSQLMYFPEVRFKEITGSTVAEINTSAQILYQNDVMVISNNALHNVPHLIVDRVNYGNIDFTELEMDAKKGNVGVKVTSQDVTVNPSRESVIWDDKTREAINNALGTVVLAASEIIEKEMTTKDMGEWLKLCANIASYRTNNPVLVTMAGLADISSSTPSFSGYPQMLWMSEMFRSWVFGMGVRTLIKPKGSKKVKCLYRHMISGSTLFEGSKPVIRRKGESIPRKNKYISSVLYPDGYIEVSFSGRPRPDVDRSELSLIFWKYTKKKSLLPYRIDELTPEEINLREEQRMQALDLVDGIYRVYMDFMENRQDYIDYDSIVVPTTFHVSEKEEEEDEVVEQGEVEKLKEAKLSAQERRKLHGTLPIAGVTNEGAFPIIDAVVSEIDNWDYDEVYYSNQDNTDLIQWVTKHINYKRLTPRYGATFIAATHHESTEFNGRYKPMSRATSWNLPCSKFFSSKELKLFRVSRENTKYFKDFKHITQFFMDVQNGVLTMSNQLVKWYTARKIHDKLLEIPMLTNFGRINTDLGSVYQKMVQYEKDHYRNVPGHEDVLAYLDKVGMFQGVVEDPTSTPEDISAMSKKLFGDEVELSGARAYDKKIVDTVNMLVDMCEPVKDLLNYVDPLLNASRNIPGELAQEIQSYILSKNSEILLTYKNEE
jgi:hypothetical protein